MAGIFGGQQRSQMPAYAIPVTQTFNDLNKPGTGAPGTPPDPNQTQNPASKLGKAAQMLQNPPPTLQNPGQSSKGLATRMLGY